MRALVAPATAARTQADVGAGTRATTLRNGDAEVGGLTALHFAARRRDVAMVEALLRAGADPLAPDERGETPYKGFDIILDHL